MAPADSAAPESAAYIVTRVTALNGTLLLVSVALLLCAVAGAIAVSWRTLGHADRLRVKLDWLRASNERLQAELKSYDSVTPPDRKRTTVMPTQMAGALSAKPKA